MPPLSGNGITLAHFTYQPARQNTTLWTWQFIPQANAGVRSVEFLLGNESLLTITGPNRSADMWGFDLDVAGRPAGRPLFTIRVEDLAGNRFDAPFQVLIDNPPALAIQSPVEGEIVSGTIRLSGTFGDDLPGASLTVSLGQTQVLSTAASPFDTTISLAGLPAGLHTIMARAGDTRGQGTFEFVHVFASSGAGLTPERLPISDPNPHLFAADEGVLLYARSDDSVWFQAPSVVETQLEDTESLNLIELRRAGWQFDDGRVAITGRTPGSPNTDVFVYSLDGTREDVPASVGLGDRGNGVALLRGPWIVWVTSEDPNTNADDLYAILNLETRAFSTARSRPQMGLDLSLAPGNERLFVSEGVPAPPNMPVLGGQIWQIHSIRLSDGTATQETATVSLHNVDPQSDEQRVAWRRQIQVHQDKPTVPLEAALIVAPVNDLAAEVEIAPELHTGNRRRPFALRDGMLVYLERSAGTRFLRVDTIANRETIVANLTAEFISLSGGRVVYAADGQLFVWTPASGSRLVFEATPVSASSDISGTRATPLVDTIVHDGATLYLKMTRDSPAVYRFTLP